MARITSELASKMIGSKYDLILVASQRARELKRGSAPKVTCDDNHIVTALKEIEQGLYTKQDYLENTKRKSK